MLDRKGGRNCTRRLARLAAWSGSCVGGLCVWGRDRVVLVHIAAHPGHEEARGPGRESSRALRSAKCGSPSSRRFDGAGRRWCLTGPELVLVGLLTETQSKVLRAHRQGARNIADDRRLAKPAIARIIQVFAFDCAWRWSRRGRGLSEPVLFRPSQEALYACTIAARSLSYA